MDDASSQGADESERAKLASAAATQSVATLSPFRLRRRGCGCGCGCGCAPALFRTGAVRCVDSHSSAKSAKRRARPVGKKRRTSTARPMPPDPSRPAPSARLRPCPPLPFAPAALTRPTGAGWRGIGCRRAGWRDSRAAAECAEGGGGRRLRVGGGLGRGACAGTSCR